MKFKPLIYKYIVTIYTYLTADVNEQLSARIALIAYNNMFHSSSWTKGVMMSITGETGLYRD